MKRSDVNLMAPVGSYESLWAAIGAGANSVYFGVEKLNMRARSSVNFSLADLEQIAEIARRHHIQTYLTLNTVIFDAEIGAMHSIVERAKTAGINAIIASDQAVIDYARKQEVEVHISTQLNVSNLETLKFYAKYADVIVLARELNLEQVKLIHEQIKEQNICGPKGKLIQLEMFCHGAMCVATSGKCYMSLHENNYSANRGSCLQTCRKGYTVTNNETGYEMEIDHEYIMSPKDLCSIAFLDKMLDAGVRVLKVEGRARPAEYVKKVCETYNTAIESILENKYDNALKETLLNNLSKVFNRGFWDGYYLGQKLGEWSKSYGSSATYRKEYAAKVTNYFEKLGVAEFLLEAGTLSPGNEVLITGTTTGVIETTVAELRVDDGTVVEKVEKGQIFSLKLPQKVRRNDKLYLWIEK